MKNRKIRVCCSDLLDCSDLETRVEFNRLIWVVPKSLKLYVEIEADFVFEKHLTSTSKKTNEFSNWPTFSSVSFLKISIFENLENTNFWKIFFSPGTDRNCAEHDGRELIERRESGSDSKTFGIEHRTPQGKYPLWSPRYDSKKISECKISVKSTLSVQRWLFWAMNISRGGEAKINTRLTICLDKIKWKSHLCDAQKSRALPPTNRLRAPESQP